MKIVCENCNAKYSISDEKVKGKVFKIRCKKCGESIVVRGDAHKSAASLEKPEIQPPVAAPQPPEADEESEIATKVFDYSGFRDREGDVAVWHIVVDGQQQGPYTRSQLLEYLEAGSLDAETFVWREGYDDWIPMKDSPELMGTESASPMEQPDEGGFAAPSSGELFDEPPTTFDGGGGLFEQAGAEEGGGLFTAPEPESASPFDSGGGGLFGESEEAPQEPAPSEDVFSSTPSGPAPTGGLFDAESAGGTSDGLFSGASATGGADLFSNAGDDGSGGGIFASTDQQAADPRVDAENIMMTGQRNENSVLFSLTNLQALAAGPAAGGPAMGGGGPDLGFPSAPAAAPSTTEEASGLIDIRALASSLTAEQESNVDDLISLGGGGFTPSLGAPVLAAQQESMSLVVKLAIVAGGVLLLGLIVVIGVFLFQDKEDDLQQQQQRQIALLEKKLLEMRNDPGQGNADKIQALEKRIAAEKEKSPAIASTQPAIGGTPSSGDHGKKSTSSSTSREPKRSSSDRSSSSSRRSKPSRDDRSSRDTRSGNSSSSRSKSSSDLLKTKEPAPKPRKSSASSELDDLLGPGSGSRSKPKPKPSSSGSSGGGAPLPKNLNRSQVQAGMKSAAGAIKRCGQGAGGTITMSVTIAKTGRVISANATGAHAGTPVGLCAARAARKARFPKFDGPNLKVKYPFKL